MQPKVRLLPPAGKQRLLRCQRMHLGGSGGLLSATPVLKLAQTVSSRIGCLMLMAASFICVDN